MERLIPPSCYAITVRILSPTNFRGSRIKLIPNEDLKALLENYHNTKGTSILAKDYSTDHLDQAVNFILNTMKLPAPKYIMNGEVLIFDKEEVNEKKREQFKEEEEKREAVKTVFS
tara:strand:- start:1107 stop:1454 length:348 start_codon:yes stop_codon:yes gene_type:complete